MGWKRPFSTQLGLHLASHNQPPLDSVARKEVVQLLAQILASALGGESGPSSPRGDDDEAR